MKTMKLFFGVFFTTVLFSNHSFAQPEPNVFSLSQHYPGDNSLLNVSWADKGKALTYYTLNSEIFSNPEFKRRSVLEIKKPDGSNERLVILDREEYFEGIVSIRAHKEGNRDAVFAGTFNKGTLNGVYFEESGAPIYFGYDNTKAKNYMSFSNERIEHRLSCGIDHSDELIPVPHFTTRSTSVKQKASNNGTSVAAPLVASEDDSVTIDLMIVYTDAAEEWALTSDFGDIEGVIAQSVNLSQTALNNSKTGIRLRLVHAFNTDYNEETDGLDEIAENDPNFSASGERLRRFTQNDSDPVFDPGAGYNGFMQEVHGLRDTFGADVVSLFVKIEDTGGLGWRLSRSGGNPYRGFNLNRVQQVADTFTLIHEIGHNMGNSHSRTQQESAATDGGGLFHYSAGFQNTVSDYHTIMAYSDEGDFQEAPFFSSPNLTFLGSPTGENSNTVPTDNARSMREIKRTISNYRDTQVNAPEASLLADVITIEMNREEDLSIPFQIFNEGESVLIWDIDFGFPGGVFKRNKTQKSTINPQVIDKRKVERIKFPANFSRNLMAKDKSSVAEQILYSSSFEDTEGFSTGNYEGLSEWRAVTNSTDFIISDANPKTGSQHLRVGADENDNTKIISAPFFGYQQFGSYEIRFDFSVSSTSELFFIDIYDGKSGEQSAGITIQQGLFFSAILNEQNEVSYTGSQNAEINTNQYYEIRIIMDPDNQQITYLLDGNVMYENDYLRGSSPGELEIWHANNENHSRIDIDDIEIKQLSAPYPWLSVPESTGFTLENSSSGRSLQFTTKGVSAGTYRTTMKVRTNDPQNPLFEVPITLEVANVVSNEPNEKPEKVSLDQNYPNPFNPETTIKYTLGSSEQIRLEVFNIQGQKIATLFEGKQNAGEHEVRFDASGLSSGVYMYRLQSASQILTRQMVLIK